MKQLVKETVMCCWLDQLILHILFCLTFCFINHSNYDKPRTHLFQYSETIILIYYLCMILINNKYKIDR